MRLRTQARDEERFCRVLQTAERMRSRAWAAYLEATRDVEHYDDIEPEAWNRLQEQLAAIDQRVAHTVGSTA
jgi:hypothetical protein